MGCTKLPINATSIYRFVLNKARAWKPAVSDSDLRILIFTTGDGGHATYVKIHTRIKSISLRLQRIPLIRGNFVIFRYKNAWKFLSFFQNIQWKGKE